VIRTLTIAALLGAGMLASTVLLMCGELLEFIDQEGQ
jgi:hypothetical protein